MCQTGTNEIGIKLLNTKRKHISVALFYLTLQTQQNAAVNFFF